MGAFTNTEILLNDILYYGNCKTPVQILATCGLEIDRKYADSVIPLSVEEIRNKGLVGYTIIVIRPTGKYYRRIIEDLLTELFGPVTVYVLDLE